jgi:hypothetical protein
MSDPLLFRLRLLCRSLRLLRLHLKLQLRQRFRRHLQLLRLPRRLLPLHLRLRQLQPLLFHRHAV